MRVLFLDDDSEVLTDGLADLDESRHQVDKCTTIEAAKAALTREDGTVTSENIVLFVDHDLGAGNEGYQFVEWVRQTHPRGHLLPIVYLTGRESERGFITRQASKPYHTPSLYLGKRDFARTSFDVNAFIEQLVTEYERGVSEVERQRLDDTIRFFESLPDDIESVPDDAS